MYITPRGFNNTQGTNRQTSPKKKETKEVNVICVFEFGSQKLKGYLKSINHTKGTISITGNVDNAKKYTNMDVAFGDIDTAMLYTQKNPSLFVCNALREDNRNMFPKI